MTHRAGFATIIGRPNVGKSTLLNHLVGTKVAIVTPKPQTTRTKITGIVTRADAQVVFVDTPGIHGARSGFNRRLVNEAHTALDDADVALFVVDVSSGLGGGDHEIAKRLAKASCTTIILLNKIDRVAKPALLPMIAQVATWLPDREVFPLSARSGKGCDTLLDVVAAALPEGPALFGADEVTTATSRFMVQEFVREQLFLALAEEVPYGTAVVVEQYEDHPDRNLAVVHAVVLVDRAGHKPIVLGHGGARIKEVGTRARTGLEALLGRRVFLELFVRVEPGWADDPRRLEQIGL